MGERTDKVERRFCVAPMMGWTDRHCRYFHRLLTRRAVLYTEMLTADSVRFGDRARLLGFSDSEQPVALQLGGAAPAAMAEAARIGADYGYREVNVNVGCPSGRVRSGRFGACLMREPGRVARVVAAMTAAVPLPVTVKCRLGVDDQDTERALDALVDAVADAGCRSVIVHARKAWLDGLSPKENREVPPLDYDRVRRLKARRPDLEIILNGGLANLDGALAASNGLDGMMVGRAAYQTPWLLSAVDARVYGEVPAAPARPFDRHAVVGAMVDYARRQARDRGTPVKAIARHMLGLFQGLPGARAWRRQLSQGMHRDRAAPELLLAAASRMAEAPGPAARRAA